MNDTGLSRRALLKSAACGIGALAVAGMQGAHGITGNPLAAKDPLIPQRAKRVIFIFMAGGPSHVDTFDYKPELFAKDQKDIDFVGVRTGTFGKQSKRKLMKPMWDFKQHGECGQYVSSLFPHIAGQVDDLAFIHSMHTEGVAHGPSTLFLHTGATNLVRPSMGSWISYGLGTENENLPAYVSICPMASKGGPRNYGNAFLPSIHQGTAVGRAGSPDDARIKNVENSMLSSVQRKSRFDYMQSLNALQLGRAGSNDGMEATIKNYELAWRMQTVRSK